MDPLNPNSRAETRLGRLIAIAALALGCVALAAPPPGRQSFDIPSGNAVAALKQFSAQTREQLLFSIDALAGVRTNAVKGEMTAREALDRLLAGTGFMARKDEQSGAYSVRKASDRPNVDRAARVPTRGRPEQSRDSARAAQALLEETPFAVSVTDDGGPRGYRRRDLRLRGRVGAQVRPCDRHVQLMNGWRIAPPMQVRVPFFSATPNPHHEYDIEIRSPTPRVARHARVCPPDRGRKHPAQLR